MHVHSSGISLCSRVSPKELVRRCKLSGLDGIVLTNHFAKRHVYGDPIAWQGEYEKEYRITQKEGEKADLAVLFGIEVTPLSEGGKDYLIYGVAPSFLYREKMLYEYTLPELSDLVKEAGAVLVHAHPYRGKSTPADAKYIDGVEINCHPLYYDNAKKQVAQYAKEHSLFITCGSDYHGDVYKAPCGVYFPDWVTDERSLADALRNGDHLLKIHDIDPELVKKTNIHQGGKTEFEESERKEDT